MIIGEWLTPKQLGQLYGVSGWTIKKWIGKRKFKLIKREPGKGGPTWRINIHDEAIDPDVRNLWEKVVEKAIDSFTQNETLINKLQQIIELLEKVVEKLK